MKASARSAPAIAAILVSGFVGCNYTDGECYRRPTGGESAGVGGGVIVPTGAGGYGDVPRAPQDATGSPASPPACNEGEETPAGAEARCLLPGSDACVEQCSAVEAYCAPRAAHPYSPTSGIGDLYWCKGGWPTYTCSYQYTNGDNCTIIYPLGKWFCRYDGGKS